MLKISLILLGYNTSVPLLRMGFNDITIVTYPHSFGYKVIFLVIIDHTFIFTELNFIEFIIYLANVYQVVLKALHIKSLSKLWNVGSYYYSYPKDFGGISITKYNISTMSFFKFGEQVSFTEHVS